MSTGKKDWDKQGVNPSLEPTIHAGIEELEHRVNSGV